jgi:hypothetical protein
MRINADLNGFDSKIAKARRLRFADQNCIRLELDAKGESACVFKNLKEVFTQKNLATAESQNEDAGFGHLAEQMLDFGCSHLTVIVVIEITVDALLVAAVGEIELRAERHAQPQRPVAHLL